MKADTVTAIASLIVAIFALYFSIQDNQISRKHNILSVKPFLDLSSNSASKNIFLKNSGIGPAFIDSVRIYHKDQSLGEFQMEAWINLLTSFKFPYNIEPEITSLEGVLEQGIDQNIIYLKSNSDSEAQTVFDSILLNATIKIYYHSAYKIPDSLIWPSETTRRSIVY